MIFLCLQVSQDANRVQFNRVRSLSENYSLFIVSNGPVSPEASKKTQGILIFPFRQKISRILYPFWAAISVSRIFQINSDLKCIYSTYEPRTIITSFIFAKYFKLEWIVDLWDDPEKFLMLSRVNRSWFQTVNVIVKKIEFFVAKHLLSYADKVIIGLVPERTTEKYKLKNRQFLSITNGINLSYAFPITPLNSFNEYRTFSIFYCGTVDSTRLEGIKIAFRRILKKIQRIHFIVVGAQMDGGDGWLKEQMNEFSRKVNLEIKGQQPYGVVLNMISKSDVCICPYPNKLDLAAAYPVKIFDYMMMGRPVVASNLPGTAAIISHGKDGLLFEPGNYDEMAEYLLAIYQSEKLRVKLSSNAQKNVRKFCWDKINDQIIDFIKGGE